MDSTPTPLIDDLCSPDPARVAAALQAAAPHRETLAPVLLARLLEASVRPALWDGCKGRPSPVFLCHLAAAWKLTDAHPLIVALLRLPPDDCDAVLGDFITEGACLVLADTWPGNLRAIEALALDERAERFARGSALGAAALLAARGAIPREAAISLLARCAALPLDPDRDADSDFAGQIVSTALDLQAWELRGTITTLFERELVDPFFCGDLDAVLAELPEGAPFAPDARRFPPPIDDAWEAVRNWHYFSRDYAKEEGEPVHRGADPDWPRDDPQPYRAAPKPGRNDPCPCGSGKKYKKCCGA